MRTFIQLTVGLALTILTSTSTSAQRYYHGRGSHYYGGHYGYYGRSYGYYAPRIRTSFFGLRYNVVPYGGVPYYYTGGYFYRPYGSSFSLIFPPFGIHVGYLPYGYRTVYVGTVPYYYYNGIFYNRYENYYEVVRAPIGAEVPDIPAEAKAVVINDQKFYELNGTYFKEVIRGNGEIWYRVAGKHGVLNTDEGVAEGPDNGTFDDRAERTSPPPPPPAPPATAPVTPGTRSSEKRSAAGPAEVGTVIDQLPENSRAVVINNQKMFEAPDGTFYSEVVENNHVSYKVVGK